MMADPGGNAVVKSIYAYNAFEKPTTPRTMRLSRLC